tara:strand:+ start:75 stop:377 length:303 start_codon:yes stop_codon:yes gene_type:complete
VEGIESERIFFNAFYSPTANSQTKVSIPVNSHIITFYANIFKKYPSDEQSTMLSTFYRQPLAINRASKDPININKPTVYVAGGIQPEILKDLANDNRAEN